MKIGPCEVDDHNPDYWRVGIVIYGQHYLDRWYLKRFHKDEESAVKEYLDLLKDSYNSCYNYYTGYEWIDIGDVVRELELGLFFYRCSKEEEDTDEHEADK